MQVWQIPIRQPKGSSAPAASPATRIGVAPSLSASTPDLAKTMRPPWPGVDRRARHRLEALHRQQRRVALGVPVLGERVEQLARAGGEGMPLAPVGAEPVEVGGGDAPRGAGQLQVEAVALVAPGEVVEVAGEDDAIGGAGRVDVDHVAELARRGRASAASR